MIQYQKLLVASAAVAALSLAACGDNDPEPRHPPQGNEVYENGVAPEPNAVDPGPCTVRGCEEVD